MNVVKISNGQVEKVLQGYLRQVENKKTDKAKGQEQGTGALKQKTDSVTITSRSEEAKKARELYDKLPEVRKDLVEELKNKIESGKYEVTGKEVADKIIHRVIVDKMV